MRSKKGAHSAIPGGRIAAWILAALLIAGHFLLPLQYETDTDNGAGQRQKKELTAGESLRWTFVPETDASRVKLWLSALDDGQGITLFLTAEDGTGKTVASVNQAVSGLEENNHIFLTGRFKAGALYTMTVRAEGDGSVKLRGEEKEDGSFLPWMEIRTTEKETNPILLYFALGLVLISLVPETAGKARLRPQKTAGTAKLLPWVTFLTVAVTGLILVFLKPDYGTVPEWCLMDEETHWSNVKALSARGDFSAELHAVNTWTPGYLTLIIGMKVSGLFTPDLFVMYRAASAFQVLFFAGMAAFAVYRAPKYKAVFMAVGTMPAAICLTSGMNYDAAVIYTVLAGTALLLDMLDRDEPLDAGRAMALLFLFSFGTIAKPAYSTVLLTLLMIPKRKLGNGAQAWGFRLTVALLLVWCLAAAILPGPYDELRAGDERYADTDTTGQLAFLAAHPAELIGMPFRFLSRNWTMFVTWISSYAYVGNEAAIAWIWAGMILLAAPLAVCGEKRSSNGLKLSAGRRLLFFAVMLLSQYVLIITQYLVSSEVGGELRGMQGRYILPVWIMIALALMMPEKVRKKMGSVGNVLALAVGLACFGINLGYALHWLL